ncbi:uncharacterized protein V1510DRAFT_405149 [Dipodascopsis tothii]|uniref:uncharacterized protein n=1 Tax=Dipodascopsis tothii TaxID=44089 RepID=UPI0034CECA61
MVNWSTDSLTVPAGYETPPFPSLRWPTSNTFETYNYLYYKSDVWKFTLYWTMIMYAGFYGVAALWAALMGRKLVQGGITVGVYLAVGGAMAFLSGSIVGAILALVYSAGSFIMSTWIPFVWGVVQIFTLVMSSYSMSSIVL